MPNVVAAMALLCVAAGLGASQNLPAETGSGRQAKETAHLAIRTSAGVPPTATGRKVSLYVDVTPKPKMHVYSPGQAGYIAIALTLDVNPAFTAAKAAYPEGEKLFMPALNETQIVYAKPFRITQDVTLKQAQGPPLTIKGSLRYQACDDKICYLPLTVPVEWTIRRSPPR